MGSFQKLSIVVLMLTALLGNQLMLSRAQMLCNMSASDLMACKPSVSGPTPVPPSDGCCSALSQADLKCLCGYKNSKWLASIGINPKLAMQLPQLCNLTRPSRC